VAIDWEQVLPPKGFRVLPRRWVVERTFSWLGQNGRMSKDYERLCETSEACVDMSDEATMVNQFVERKKC
jgi:putative transposase